MQRIMPEYYNRAYSCVTLLRTAPIICMLSNLLLHTMNLFINHVRPLCNQLN